MEKNICRNILIKHLIGILLKKQELKNVFQCIKKKFIESLIPFILRVSRYTDMYRLRVLVYFRLAYYIFQNDFQYPK